MERLADIPLKNDTVKTPEEQAIMNQLFPNSSQPDTSNPKFSPQHDSPNGGSQPNQHLQTSPSNKNPNVPNSPPARVNWKLLGIAIVLFIMLANPWIDGIFSKIPYCEGGASMIGIKSILFGILLLLANLFL